MFQSKTDSMEDVLEAVGLAGTDWERSGRASPWYQEEEWRGGDVSEKSSGTELVGPGDLWI